MEQLILFLYYKLYLSTLIKYTFFILYFYNCIRNNYPQIYENVKYNILIFSPCLFSIYYS